MKRKWILLQLLLILSLTMASRAQTVYKPNYALKSHETLEINRIEITPLATTFFMSLENRISGGYFCADINTFIVGPDGSRMKLVSSNGIPVCPDVYRFKLPGERLDFILTFPPLQSEPGWIDLIEDCTDNCFSFYGITTDPALNNAIEEAFALNGKGESSQALDSFIGMARAAEDGSRMTGGLLYLNIIKLAEQTGNKTLASEWYRKLVFSGIPRREMILRHLNSQGIRY
ncbi:MAG: hypothetical protein K0B05_00575 [Bacteroidales bacterium]|nr:hypothetical protein [Bacteroidales bacterium]